MVSQKSGAASIMSNAAEKSSKRSPFRSEAHLLDLALRTETGQGQEKEILV